MHKFVPLLENTGLKSMEDMGGSELALLVEYFSEYNSYNSCSSYLLNDYKEVCLSLGTTSAVVQVAAIPL